MENLTAYDKELFANRLKEARNSKNMTQTELSELTGVSLMMISSYENTKTKSGKNPAFNNVYLLANALGVSIDWLCGISDNREPNKGGNISTKDFLYAVTELVDNSEKVNVKGCTLHGNLCQSIEFIINSFDSYLSDFIKDYQAVKVLRNTIPETYTMLLNTVIEKYSKKDIKKLLTDYVPFSVDGEE